MLSLRSKTKTKNTLQTLILKIYKEKIASNLHYSAQKSYPKVVHLVRLQTTN
jgi:hypothetical protein